ncbi:MAG: hypothetical protein ABI823_21280, partial [Bryobacteraceae bacterium]
MVLGLITIGLAATSGASASTINLFSGNGSIGGADATIKFLLGPGAGDFANPFSNTDFMNAQNGTAAQIVAPNGA